VIDLARHVRKAANLSPLGVAASGATLVLLALATSTKADSDLWGHLKFGLDILGGSGLSANDPYSFTQDRPWVNHEWFSELQMAVAYSVAGISGLALLKGALVAAALALCWSALAHVRTDVRIVVFAGLAAGTVPVTRTLRPQLWTLLALAILCRTLLASDRQRRRWLPLLFAVWANSHGGWIVGFAVLAMWAALEAWEERELRTESVRTVVLCALATLVTPYGWNLWVFLATTVSLTGRAITEWQPLWNAPQADSVPWVMAVLATIWLARQRLPGRLAVLGVQALLAYASLKVVRIVPLFVLCTVILLSGALARRFPLAFAKPVSRPATGEWPLAAALLVMAFALTAWLLSASLACIPVDRGPRAVEASAVRLLQGGEGGRLVTFFDWGEYAIWHLSPRFRVSMDGRRETVYSDARLDEHGAILHGTVEGLAILEDWQPEYVWLPATSRGTKNWLVEHGYRLEHDTERSFVAVRPDLPPLFAHADLNPNVTACFPG
jgi:hypothetical protein